MHIAATPAQGSVKKKRRPWYTPQGAARQNVLLIALLSNKPLIKTAAGQQRDFPVRRESRADDMLAGTQAYPPRGLAIGIQSNRFHPFSIQRELNGAR